MFINLFRKFKDFTSNFHISKTRSMIVIVLLLISLPFTINLLQNKIDLRQRAQVPTVDSGFGAKTYGQGAYGFDATSVTSPSADIIPSVTISPSQIETSITPSFTGVPQSSNPVETPEGADSYELN